MRTISAQEITDTVARLCIEANTRLPQDVQAALDLSLIHISEPTRP